jgi:hypothetical protein
MKLEWAIACWALSSLYHDWRTSDPVITSSDILVLKEELSVIRVALANLEEGHLTCGWRLKISNWFLQVSVGLHLLVVVYWGFLRNRLPASQAPSLAIGDTVSTDSEEIDSSPSGGSRQSGQQGQLPLRGGKGRPVRPSDLKRRHGGLYPQHQ